MLISRQFWKKSIKDVIWTQLKGVLCGMGAPVYKGGLHMGKSKNRPNLVHRGLLRVKIQI